MSGIFFIFNLYKLCLFSDENHETGQIQAKGPSGEGRRPKWRRSSGGSWGRGRSNHGSGKSPAPSLPASFTGNAGKNDGSVGGGGDTGGGAGGGGKGGQRGTPSGVGGETGSERGFLVERNSVAGANPMSRWRVSSDGRELTEMEFAPCKVDGRRLVALGALDGVSHMDLSIEATPQYGTSNLYYYRVTSIF